MIKAIFFDVGGVLMESEHKFDAIYKEFGEKIGLPPGLSAAIHKKYLKRMNHGHISAEAVLSLMKKRAKRKGDFMKIWVGIVMKHIVLNKDVLSIVDRVRQKYRMAILSNVNGARELVDKKFGLYQHFDRVFLSHRLKMKKPFKNFYRYALQEMHVEPKESIFIDDREKFVSVARQLGMKGIRFENAAKLRARLKKLGVMA